MVRAVKVKGQSVRLVYDKRYYNFEDTDLDLLEVDISNGIHEGSLIDRDTGHQMEWNIFH